MTNDKFLEWPRIVKKQYARRSLVSYRSPYLDSFEYRSISEVGRDEVFRLMERSTSEIKQYESLTAKEKFDSLVEFAGTAYQPKHWLIAYREGTPIGYVFPQRYFDIPEEGSIFDLAVVPEFRSNGYGKILHSKGLEMLASMGVTNYVGSTEIQNERMIAIFLANGCTLTKVRMIQIEEDGTQRFLNP